jgi:hypothetical protein
LYLFSTVLAFGTRCHLIGNANSTLPPIRKRVMKSTVGGPVSAVKIAFVGDQGLGKRSEQGMMFLNKS